MSPTQPIEKTNIGPWHVRAEWSSGNRLHSHFMECTKKEKTLLYGRMCQPSVSGWGLMSLHWFRSHLQTTVSPHRRWAQTSAAESAGAAYGCKRPEAQSATVILNSSNTRWAVLTVLDFNFGKELYGNIGWYKATSVFCCEWSIKVNLTSLDKCFYKSTWNKRCFKSLFLILYRCVISS